MLQQAYNAYKGTNSTINSNNFIANGYYTVLLDSPPGLSMNNQTNDNQISDNQSSLFTISQKIGIGIAATGATVLTIAAIPIIMGFGAAGVVAGSVAAGIQAGIGSVAAGSLFAAAQSWAALGFFTSAAWAGGTAAVVGTGAAIIASHNSTIS